MLFNPSFQGIITGFSVHFFVNVANEGSVVLILCPISNTFCSVSVLCPITLALLLPVYMHSQQKSLRYGNTNYTVVRLQYGYLAELFELSGDLYYSAMVRQNTWNILALLLATFSTPIEYFIMYLADMCSIGIR